MDPAVRVASTPIWSGPVKIASDSDDNHLVLKMPSHSSTMNRNAHIISLGVHYKSSAFLKIFQFFNIFF